MLIIVCGLPGTGKSTLSEMIAKELPAVHLNSDAIRKEMFRKPEYTDEEKEQVYSEMTKKAEAVLLEGKNVILDATFYKRRYRKMMADLSDDVYRIKCVLPEDEIRKRLAKRKELGKSQSDADYDVYQALKDEFEGLEGRHLEIDCSLDKEEIRSKVMGFLGVG